MFYIAGMHIPYEYILDAVDPSTRKVVVNLTECVQATRINLEVQALLADKDAHKASAKGKGIISLFSATTGIAVRDSVRKIVKKMESLNDHDMRCAMLMLMDRKKIEPTLTDEQKNDLASCLLVERGGRHIYVDIRQGGYSNLLMPPAWSVPAGVRIS